MGCYQQLEQYTDIGDPNRLNFVNDLIITSNDDKVKLMKMIRTDLGSNESFSLLPACGCGHTKEERRLGMICKKCGTEVVRPIEDVKPTLWIRAPAGIHSLMNIKALTTIMYFFGKKNFNIIRWIIDKSYVESRDMAGVVMTLEAQGIQRGYNYFVQNFYQIINVLLELKMVKDKHKVKKMFDSPIDEFRQWLEVNKNNIFCHYLPVLNKSFVVVENEALGVFADPLLPEVVEGIKLFVGIDNAINNYSIKRKEHKVVKALLAMVEFWGTVEKEVLGGKPGLFRKHVAGTRSQFSFRAVISSLTGKHKYDELHIPWNCGVEVYRLHLINKLLKRGYSIKAAFHILHLNERNFDYQTGPLLSELFKELIEESPRKGLPVILNRNPTMNRGSQQRLRVTRVKEDSDDVTISMSILIVKTFNADFDGDALAASIMHDLTLDNLFEELSPHYNIISAAHPRSHSDANSLPKPAVFTISNWLRSTKNYKEDPNKVNKMLDLFAA